MTTNADAHQTILDVAAGTVPKADLAQWIERNLMPSA